MKGVLCVLIYLCSVSNVLSQNKIDTIHNGNELTIRQHLDDSTIFMNTINSKDGISKQVILSLVDTLWIMTSQLVFKNGTLIDLKEGSKNGLGRHKVYSNDGTFTTLYECKNWNSHGKFFSFYPNGSLKQQGYFDENFKIGKWITFTESGDTSIVENYIIVDLEFNDFVNYTQDEMSEMIFRGNTDKLYTTSVKDGQCKMYSEGKISKIVTYDRGRKKQ